MRFERSPLHVKYKEALKLIAISTEAGRGGEETIMTLTPVEAISLGTVLADMGREKESIRA